METGGLPRNVVPASGTINFTADTIPVPLTREHALSAGHWGILHIFQGTLRFETIDPPEHQVVSAPDLVTIHPEVPHRIESMGPVRCRIDFFRETDDAPTRTPGWYADDDVNRSFERCESNGDFAETFYRYFFDSSPEIPGHFKNTDFHRQRRVLRDSVHLMVTRDVADVEMRRLLENLGTTHSRHGRNIRPELYEYWLDSVCAAAAQLDPQWSKHLEREWRVRLRAGMQIVTAAY